MPRSNDSVDAIYRATSSLRGALQARDAATLRDQVALTRIAAPTGSEELRAAWIADRFRALGLGPVRIDGAGNVIARRHGLQEQLPVVVCAHMDTVFPVETELSVRAEKSRLRGPGIGDNARGLAGMLAIAETLCAERLVTIGPIDFVASTGEEGGGNLRGAKYYFAQHGDTQSMVVLDGPGDSRIVNTALGSVRYRIIYSGPGGHSWSAYGAPNPAHAVGVATAIISAIRPTQTPRSTLTVSRIGGGIAVNAIPSSAWLEVDARSSSEDVLERLSDEVLLAAHDALRTVNRTRRPETEELELRVEIIGRRPCGGLAAEHPLARAATRATELIGREPELAVASTDANVPLSLGVPAIAIGAGGRGGNAHTMDEWFENANGAAGLERAATIILAAAGLPGV